MRTIVISQPMFFPWVGLFEQIYLSDIYIHYDDVQIPQGRSFISRVQIKTAEGIRWLTVPICREGKKLIKDVKIDDTQKWREKHINMLQHAYAKAKYFDDMMQIIFDVYSQKSSFISEINIYAINKISRYFSINTNFKISSHHPNTLHSSEKILELVSKFNGTKYVTGWGAKNYLDHTMFEAKGIRVEYIDYQKQTYNQLYGEFTPYVSILDLIANEGKAGKECICSKSKYWRDFIEKRD